MASGCSCFTWCKPKGCQYIAGENYSRTVVTLLVKKFLSNRFSTRQCHILSSHCCLLSSSHAARPIHSCYSRDILNSCIKALFGICSLDPFTFLVSIAACEILQVQLQKHHLRPRNYSQFIISLDFLTVSYSALL